MLPEDHLEKADDGADSNEPDPNQLDLVIEDTPITQPAPDIPPPPPVRHPNPEDWRYRISPSGTAEAFNPQTGEVAHRDLRYEDMDKYEVVVIEGERWWVSHTGQSQEEFSKPGIRYSTLIGDVICGLILEGSSLKNACRAVGITYAKLCKWRRHYSDFGDAFEQAKRDRAEGYFEKLVETVEATGPDKDEVALARLKTDVYKYVAGIGDEKLSPVSRQKIDARIGVASIETGIRRPGDVGFEEGSDFAEIGRVVANGE